MSQWSLPIQQTPPGWKLRVLSGRMLGTEFDLPNSRYVLGSQSPSDIVIAHPEIAPQHVAIELRSDGVHLTDTSRGRGVLVNGQRVRTAHVAPGDHVEVGPLKFEFSNPNYKAPLKPGSADTLWTWLEKRPLWQRVGGILLVVAVVLFVLLACTGTPTLFPVTVRDRQLGGAHHRDLLDGREVRPQPLLVLHFGRHLPGGGHHRHHRRHVWIRDRRGGHAGPGDQPGHVAGFVEEPAKLLGTACGGGTPGTIDPWMA